MNDSILKSTSFSTLDEAGKDAVRLLYNENYKKGEAPQWDIQAISAHRETLALSISIYGQKLSKANAAGFKYLNPQERFILSKELLFTFYLLSAQFHLDEVEHRRQNIRAQSDQIKHCAKLIHDLRAFENKKMYETELELAMDDSEKHLKFLGLTVVAPFITEKMSEFTTGKTSVIRSWMGDINGRRLYWVWGGGLLASVIAMLPDSFAYKGQGEQAIAAPSPITGNMSWLLYYARFGMNFGLLLKHSIAGSWMSEEEQLIPEWDRFKTQWAQRKFSLLNDSIWGVANMVCYFWLTGGGLAGYFGNVVTAGLLLMDVCLNTWRFMEETTQHNQTIQRFERDMGLLKGKISLTQDPEKTILDQELEALEKTKKIYEFDWKYKKYSTINDLVYSVGLLAAFSVVTCFFFPPSAIVPATALLLGLVGAALCFTANFITAAVAGWLEVSKTQESTELSKKDCDLLLAHFITRNKNLSDFVKRAMFLEMKQLMVTSEYQEQVIEHQKMKLLRGMLVDALIPPLFFASFVLMPLGFGLGLFAGGVALASATNEVIEQNVPQSVDVPEFNEEAYQKFLAQPKLKNLMSKQNAPKGNSFFAIKENKWLDDNDIESGLSPVIK